MKEYLDLLAKAQATRNAQLIHTRCPTMMNNFIKIVYEVSFDKLLRDKTALVKAAGHKVEFPKSWVNPQIPFIKAKEEHFED